jgi:hypothetical protein
MTDFQYLIVSAHSWLHTRGRSISLDSDIASCVPRRVIGSVPANFHGLRADLLFSFNKVINSDGGICIP